MGKTQDIREAVEAELNAHVRTWAEHDAAVGAARMAGGVFEVHHDLAITG